MCCRFLSGVVIAEHFVSRWKCTVDESVSEAAAVGSNGMVGEKLAVFFTSLAHQIAVNTDLCAGVKLTHETHCRQRCSLRARGRGRRHRRHRRRTHTKTDDSYETVPVGSSSGGSVSVDDAADERWADVVLTCERHLHYCAGVVGGSDVVDVVVGELA